VKAKTLLLFWTKVATVVMAMWGGYLLVGALRGEHASFADVIVGTLVVLGFAVVGLVIDGPEAPWLPWRYRRWKKERESAQARHQPG